ncbi:MAG: hypothetical protein H6602_06015 [Flavobacteriales bacterium]|nr:hypothetical protein [Flavobacteriales bacterium]
MKKTIRIALNRFPEIPDALRADPRINAAVSEVEIDLGILYHHYYMDGYGVRPPRVNHFDLEYLRFITGASDFRFRDDAVASAAKKRTLSQELGQAFFRYFMSEYLGIKYFAHMDKVLGKSTHAGFDGMSIIRRERGDVPDYLCARSVVKPFIGEAKGRFRGVSFGNNEFDNWRMQFQRISVLDRNGIPIRVKGYIVGTSFREEHHSRSYSKLYCEDPYSYGDTEFIEGEHNGIGRTAIIEHYARVCTILGFRLLSARLHFGIKGEFELIPRIRLWKPIGDLLDGEGFVGIHVGQYRPSYPYSNRRYDGGLFIGLRSNVFHSLIAAVRGDWSAVDSIDKESRIKEQNSVSNDYFTYLNDGTVIGISDLFRDSGTLDI